MPHRNKKLIPKEHRQYLRLDTVFPVQFRFKRQGDVFLSPWQQGFTNNISRGGMCLSVNNLEPGLRGLFNDRGIKLALEIDIPVSRKPVTAQASIVWFREIPGEKYRCLAGLNYDSIPAKENSKLMRYAWARKLFVPVALTAVIILAAGLGLNSYLNYKLTRGNKLLIERLAGVIKDSTLARQKINRVITQRQAFQSKLNGLEERIQSIESRKAQIQTGDSMRFKQLNGLVAGLTKEKLVLEAELAAVKQKENSAAKEIVKLDEQQGVLEKANFDKMYQWLKIHQSKRTGLVSSFEGDKEIANWSFTYDQALLVQAYTRFGDPDRAKKILEFFATEAKRENGWFFNAYYVDDGAPAEFVMHSGPNIWLGLAIMQYIQGTGDKSYLGLAEDIAGTIIRLQNEDAAGGIRGGPAVSWYATEHNLDGYAFFNMLAEVTQKPIYAQAAQKALSWMVSNTYDRPDLPIKRGKGDSTIATDTYAWSIAAIGPEKLLALGMNPDKILEFVEENCSVEVDFMRANGQSVKVRGFDFAPQRHTARGGVVSSEWTGQMIVSYKIMEDFYRKKGEIKKAEDYGLKARMYLSQLGNMIISSPSPSGQGEGCLPYATQDQVDTGHGWATPKGSHTGSVSGTTYTLFAYYGFNPLKLKE